MKSGSKKTQKKTLQISKETKEALGWADNLSPEQKAKFELLGRIHAEKLMRKAYLLTKKHKSPREGK